MSIIGSSLEAVRRDLKYMPTQTLIQYKQNPAKNAVDGIPMDMLAGLELSRRAQMQTELSAAGAQNAANMPTVTDAAAQQLMGQPQQPPAPQPAPQQPAPPPQQAAPQPQPQAPQPPMPQMQQAPQGGLPTVNKAAGGQITGRVINDISDLRDLLGGGYAGGGIIAFANRGEVPNAYAGYENVVPESLRSERAETPPEDSVLVDPRAYPAYSAKQKEKKEKKSEAVKADEQKAPPLPPLPPPYIAPPSQLSLTEGLYNLYKNSGGGGGIPAYKPLGITPPEMPDRSVMEAKIEGLGGATAEETNARMAQQNFAADLAKRKSPFMTDAEKAAAEDAQFKKYQALYDPVNAETQKVLDERRAALEERRGRRLSEAGLQLGLGMLGGRGNFASILSGAGKEAVGTYQKGQELDDAQNERIQDMHLKQQQALVAQKAGNMDLAHRLAREAQADKLAIDNYEIAKQEKALGAQQKAAEISGIVRGRELGAQVHLDKVQTAIDKAEMGINVSLQLAEAKAAMQHELAVLRSANADVGRQFQLFTLINKIEDSQRKAEAARLPTPEGLTSIYKLVDQDFSTSPGLLNAGISRLRGGAQLVADYQRNPNDPKVAAEYGEAARRVRDLAAKEKLSGTRTPGAAMDLGSAYEAVK
jgi:hypothetical protein